MDFPLPCLQISSPFQRWNIWRFRNSVQSVLLVYVSIIWPFFISNHSDTIRLVFWNMAFIFPYIGNSNPNWLIFFRGVGQPPISTMILCRSLAFWDPHIWRRSPQKRGPSPTPSPISIHLDTCYPENRWDSDKTPGWTVNYHGKLGGSK